MICQRIHLLHFRNYCAVELRLHAGVNILLGDNGSGKTNLLEGIYFLGHLSGFRADGDASLLRRGAKSLFVEGDFVSDAGAHLHAEVRYTGGQKYVRVNEVPVLKLADYWGRIPLYLFSPASMELLWGRPERRRELWDGELAKFSPQFRTELANYRTAWLSRNRTLKLLQQGRQDAETGALMKFYTDSLVHAGGRVVLERLRFLSEVLSKLDEYYRQLTAEKYHLRAHYSASIGKLGREVSLEEVRRTYRQRLAELAGRERERGFTLAGPHRDDVRFFLGEVPIADFASQGQVRAATIALMLTLARIYRERTREEPVLLLDDVLSELDDKRKANLLAIVGTFPQAVLTSASRREIRGLLPLKPRLFAVGGGTVKPVTVTAR